MICDLPDLYGDVWEEGEEEDQSPSETNKQTWLNERKKKKQKEERRKKATVTYSINSAFLSTRTGLYPFVRSFLHSVVALQLQLTTYVSLLPDLLGAGPTLQKGRKKERKETNKRDKRIKPAHGGIRFGRGEAITRYRTYVLYTMGVTAQIRLVLGPSFAGFRRVGVRSSCREECGE